MSAACSLSRRNKGDSLPFEGKSDVGRGNRSRVSLLGEVKEIPLGSLTGVKVFVGGLFKYVREEK